MGGVVGFLRFNTFPARVFMGDAGSQFLGFTLGVVVILLTQQVDTAAAKALGGLLIGLPIIDIMAVFAQRVYHRMNWFRATKNHIHHRLLQIGFHHYEAVAIIYGVQGLFMASAVLFAYESDAFIVGLYFATCAIVFLLIWRAERSGWRAHAPGGESRLARLISGAGSHWVLAELPICVVRLGVPLYIVLAAMVVSDVPDSSALPVVFVAAQLGLGLVFARSNIGLQAFRLAVYGSIALLAYVLQSNAPLDSLGMKVVHAVFLGGLAMTIWLVVRFAPKLQFATSPMDVLVVLIVLSGVVFAQFHASEPRVMLLVIEAMILFYGTELIIQLGSRRWNRVLGGAALAALGILGAKLALT
jgi:UDP-GlcNAc:undecaprenyl-phosphate GlcNAc-1-phosphate transferase